ncbi:MAG: hypothetical protein V4747_07510 [Pseudomonadota bacterium]
MSAVDDATAEAANLSLLLDATEGIVRDSERTKADGTRHAELDQVAALVKIAADMARALVDRIEALPSLK